MKRINIEENIENRIIDLITKGSEDRLIAFKPKENIKAVDLVVKKRGDYKGKEISFQVNIFIGPSKTNSIVKDILQKNFNPDKDFYLMFVYFDEVKQSINNVWIIPSFMFSEIAEPQKLENNKTVLRFETSADKENKDKYTRFLITQKELGNFLLEIIENKGKLNFTKNNFLEDKEVNLDKLEKFITEARRNTYAVGSKSIENPRLSGSTQLEYQKADYFYQDIYFTGSKRFIGQEIVYYNNKPVWAMNYFGSIVEKEILDFLKKSLSKLSQECRLGKKCQFEKRELRYQDEGQGSLGRFLGEEQIFQKNKNVYSLTYQGGIISK